MDEDLQTVGLDALDALEAQDEATVEETSETEETSAEDAQVEEVEEQEPEEETEEETPAEEEKAEEEPAKEEEKKELTDEEFEELAKKRGYSKEQPKEEVKEEPKDDEALKCPKEIDEELWNSLPEENRRIYNALPYLTAEGKHGTVKIKTASQLPDNFEFKNTKAAMAFQTELQAQELKATKLAEQIESETKTRTENETRQAEARQIISEVEALQKSGDLPTPKAKYGDKAFDTDPAVDTINKVLGYRAERNAKGANLTVEDALMLYKAHHPDEFAPKEDKVDAERTKVAKKIAGVKGSGTPVNSDKNKPAYYRTGMSTEDVLDRVLDEMEF